MDDLLAGEKQKIDLAITNLVAKDISLLKQESLQVLVEALGNKQITQENWHQLFNNHVAKYTLKQKADSLQMVRILTLRTLVIPETLPDYLDWLQVKDNLQKRNFNQGITESLKFQSKLRLILTRYPQITKRIKYFVKQLRGESIPTKFWERIGDYIKENLSDSTLATFYYKLAALFEQDYVGNVNEKLFIKVFGSSPPSRPNIFDINIIKKEPIKVQPQIVIFIAISSLLIGGVIGGIIDDQLINLIDKQLEEDIMKQSPVIPDVVEQE